jgi:hypothetical protein
MGCLQDVHWSFGGMGYFPTYSLGSFYAAQWYLEMNKNPNWTNPYDFSIRDAVKEYILVNNIPNENVFYSLADNEYRQALKPDLNWKLIWIQNGGIGSSYTTAKFIAQEFLPRL